MWKNILRPVELIAFTRCFFVLCKDSIQFFLVGIETVAENPTAAVLL